MELHPIQLAQGAHGLVAQSRLMRLYGRTIVAVEPVYGRLQANGFKDRRRAGLETMRRLVVGDALALDDVDHLAAAFERRHRRQQVAFAVEDTDTGRTVELVAGERVEIDIERLHINTAMNDRLAAIEHDRHALSVRDADDLRRRRLRAQHVRHMRERHHLGARRDQ